MELYTSTTHGICEKLSSSKLYCLLFIVPINTENPGDVIAYVLGM